MQPLRSRDSLLAVAALLVSLLAFAVAAAAVNYIFRDPSQPAREAQLAALATLLNNRPAAVMFSGHDDTIVISEPERVSQFLSLLLDPDPVPAHHTHPEGEILVQFAGDPSVYLLGRDSRVPNEFWLQLQQEQQTVLTLKRLRSAALASWLYDNLILTRTRH